MCIPRTRLNQAAGGVFSTSALFPLEVVKINLQARRKDAMSAKDAPDIEDNEKELTRASVENAVVGEEGLQSRAVSQPGRQGDEEKAEGRRLISKSEGKHRSPSMLSIARDVFSREGCLGFYRGVCYASSQSGVEKAAYFYGYGWLKALALRVSGGRELNTVTDLVLGYFAEALHLPLTIPIEVGEGPGERRFSICGRVPDPILLAFNFSQEKKMDKSLFSLVMGKLITKFVYLCLRKCAEYATIIYTRT